jgi:peptidoglycan/LPS O-acetylase OafA/YrhL
MPYRKEIDGLRALAVFPVIFFHAGFELFSRGFLGVDIFFVISGYLITSLILREQSLGTFSIINFYERRARRIIPALFLVMMVCIPFAIYLMQPDDLENFGQSLVATTLISNNYLLYLTSGYWDLASEFKPLLHTWSLGVEEQYYILFPILMLLAWKIGLKIIFFTFVLLSSLSLLHFYNLSSQDNFGFNNESFLLLKSRAWQILFGAIAAIFLFKFKESKFLKSNLTSELFSLIGIGCLVFSFFLFKESSFYQGVFSFSAVTGTLFIILFSKETTFSTRFLVMKYVVGLGLISYSLYLWHQPIFAFLRIISLEKPSEIALLLSVVLALIISIFSYRLEKFFRDKKAISSKGFFSAGLICLLLIVGTGLYLHLSEGFYKSYPELQNSELKGEYSNTNDGYVISASKFLDKDFVYAEKSNLLITGDSFARDFINMGESNGYFSNYELSLKELNCFNNNEISSESFKDPFDSADIVVISYRILRTEKEKSCFLNQLNYLQSSNKEFIVIGTKDFGYNLNRPLKKKMYDYKALVSEEILLFNRYLSETIPEKNFIDVLGLIADKNNRVYLFTSERKMISVDRAHLTYFGAREIGKTVFEDPLLKDLK